MGPASALHFRPEARAPARRWSPPRGGGPKCGRWSSGLSRAFPDCSWLERALKHPRSTVNASSGLAINDIYNQKKSVRLVEVRASKLHTAAQQPRRSFLTGTRIAARDPGRLQM